MNKLGEEKGKLNQDFHFVIFFFENNEFYYLSKSLNFPRNLQKLMDQGVDNHFQKMSKLDNHIDNFTKFHIGLR